LENFAHDLQDSLVEALPKPVARQDAVRYSIRQRGEQLLKGLGIVNNAGAEDLLDILNWLGSNKEGMQHQPSLRKIFTSVAAGEKETDNPEREAKAMEQRLRRLIFQGMVNMATMGVVDCTNPKFEECAPLYFEYADICSMMRMIDKNQKPQMSQVHINIKKFINALFTAAQEGK
jgi:two-component system response regulator YcbB